MESVRIACQGAGVLDIQFLEPYQGNLKDLSSENYEKLKREILELGFSEPISVWAKDGKSLCLNGHQRLRTLKQMREEGFDVPQIPVNFVEAVDEKEAKKKILALTSQYGEITGQGLREFMHDSGLEFLDIKDSFRFPEIDFDSFETEFFKESPPPPVAEDKSLSVSVAAFESHIHHGDCLVVLKTLQDNSADSLVTDPPAGISFMGKEWDDDKGGRDQWILWLRDVMMECLRVLKPGGHALIWAIPRTSHWTTSAIEDAGFEIRDVITHLFGQGFPKSLDISKAIDRMNGDERPVVGKHENPASSIYSQGVDKLPEQVPITSAASAASAASAEWEGWGTALKPAAEFWVLARKPLSEKTVAENVLKWGTGALAIDACRIGASGGPARSGKSDRTAPGGFNTGHDIEELNAGRFPANLVLSHHAECEQVTVGGSRIAGFQDKYVGGKVERGVQRMGYEGEEIEQWKCHENCAVRMLDEQSDNASRFFYCAKISPGERNEGLDEMPDTVLAKSGGAAAAAARGETYFEGSGFNKTQVVKNSHPTVKPLKLMRYLIRLITPPGGQVLDVFAGSGSAGVAAIQEGFRFVGIEREAEYVEIARKRIEHLKVEPEADEDLT